MTFVSLRSAAAALALTAVCGSAHAFSAKGNYDTTFTFAGTGPVTYCVTLASQGAEGVYRDSGTATFFNSAGTLVASGSYVVLQKTIAVAVENANGIDYLTAAGQFMAGQAFNTVAIDFANGAGAIYGTATFQYSRNHGSCASGGGLS